MDLSSLKEFPESRETLGKLWAKRSPETGTYPLFAHLLDTTVAAKAVWDVWLRRGLKQIIADSFYPGSSADDDRVRNLVMFIAALHDLGKANPVFQGQCAAKDKVGTSWAQDLLRNLGIPWSKLCLLPGDRDIESKDSVRRHEQVSGLHLSASEKDFRRQYGGENWLSLVVLSHHGYFRIGEKPHNTFKLRNGLNDCWKQMRDTVIYDLAKALDIDLASLPSRIGPVPILLLSGTTILSDRLASGDEWVKRQQELLKLGVLDTAAPQAWIEKSYPRMEERLKENLGVFTGLADSVRSILGEHEPFAAQKEAMRTGRGLWTVMAPTGSGKTEAALLRHENSPEPERLIFLLPTQATSNAIMHRMQRVFDETGNIASLAHSLASLDDFYNVSLESAATKLDEELCGGLHPTEFVSSGSSRLLAPLCVGTIDQALIAAFPRKWIHLRLLALANAHIVIDEVHTLDAYQSALLEPLMEWWSLTDTRVTLLSATQAKRQFQGLVGTYLDVLKDEREKKLPLNILPEFPATSICRRDLEQPINTELEISTSRISYRISAGDETNPKFPSVVPHMNWAVSSIASYPDARLGIFVNRIDTAQKIAKSLVEHFSNDSNPPEILCLHSRMTAKHRNDVSLELEKKLGKGKDGKRIIVVGTQAIEASLDIDFDLISTDIAPTPSLIQRAGRGWRHDDPLRTERISGPGRRLENLEMNIVSPSTKGFHAPYLEAVIKRSISWLEERASNGEGIIEVPGDIQEMVDRAWIDWFDVKDDSDINAAIQDQMKADHAKQFVGALNILKEEDPRVDDYMWLTIQDEGTDEKTYQVTRYFDRPNIQVLLAAEDTVPGACSEKVYDVPAKTPLKVVRQILQSVISLSNPEVVEWVKKNCRQVDANAPALLRGKYVLPATPPFNYDPLVGLLWDFTAE